MRDCTKINLNLFLSNALILKQNVNGIDSSLLKNLDALRKKFNSASWLGLLDLPLTKNNQRLIQFAESRRCLVKALKELKPTEKSDHSILTSISHTPLYSAAFVALIEGGCRVSGVGLDIEDLSRNISPAAIKKFTLTSELNLEIMPVELWTAKEASYKANSKQNKVSLFNYEIKTFNPKLRCGTSGLIGSPNGIIDFKIVSFEGLCITIAVNRA